MKALLLLAAIVLLALLPDKVVASPAYWRFENNPGFIADSGAGGISLALSGDPTPATSPVVGTGFPANLLSEPNSGAADLGGTGYFTTPDSAFFDPSEFTLEAFVRQASRGDSTAYIVSKWTFSSTSKRSWGLGISGNEPPTGLVPGELFMILSPDGATTTVVGSGIILETGRAYSVAAVSTSGSLAFHVKDLVADGPLLTSFRGHGIAAFFDSSADVLVGAYATGSNRFDGFLDEVRFTKSALDPMAFLSPGTQASPPPVFTSTPSSKSPAKVTFQTVSPGTTIRYTLDGSEPTAASTLYSEPFTIVESATLKARAFHPDLAPSEILEHVFTFTGLPYLGPIRPRLSSEIESSPWSVGAETLDRDYAIYTNFKEYLDQTGVKSVRIQAGWAKTEKVAGEYDWAWLDEIVFDASARGVRPWMNVSYGNPVYSGGGGTGLGDGLLTSAGAKAAWDAWLLAMVTRYKDHIHEWEIWNEPTSENFPAADYAEMFIRSAGIIRGVQPEARLIGIAFAGINLPYADTLLRALRDDGKLGLLDEISYHAYIQVSENHYDAVQGLRNKISSFSGTSHITVRQGENGAPSERGGFGALSGYAWSEVSQAKWNLRRMLGDLGRDIPSNCFTLMELHYPSRVNDKGLLLSDSEKRVVRPKQAFYALRNLTALFDSRAVRIRSFPVTHNGGSSLNVFGYNRGDLSKPMVTLWKGGGTPQDTDTISETNITLPLSNFTNPVIADLRTGTVRSVPDEMWTASGGTTTFSGIPVTDSPLVLADLDCVYSPYDLWVLRNFSNGDATDLSVTGKSSLFGNTGIANLATFALDTSRPLATTSAAGSPGLAFTRQSPAPLTYSIQTSTDLGATDPWRDIAVFPKGASEWIILDDGYGVSETTATTSSKSVSVTLPTGHAARFLRVSVIRF